MTLSWGMHETLAGDVEDFLPNQDQLEDGCALVSGDILVSMEVDHEARDILNDAPDWGHITLIVLKGNTNFGPSDVEARFL